MQTPERNGCAMKTKIGNKEDWRRVFKFLPVTTVDGYRVSFGYVWVRVVDGILEDVNEYHTNPNRLEDGLQSINDMLPRLRKTQQIKDWEVMRAMRPGSNPMPPVKRPKRPPPPPAPPRKIHIGGGTMHTTGSTSVAIGHNNAKNVVIVEKGREAKVCLKCGTIDCDSGLTKFKMSDTGAISTTSEDILNSCKDYEPRS